MVSEFDGTSFEASDASVQCWFLPVMNYPFCMWGPRMPESNPTKGEVQSLGVLELALQGVAVQHGFALNSRL